MTEFYFIYKLFCKTNPKQFYIGSTKDLYSRISQHKSSCKKNNSKLYSFIRNNGGFKNFEFKTLIYKYSIEDKVLERKSIEELHISICKPTLNTAKIYRTEFPDFKKLRKKLKCFS